MCVPGTAPNASPALPHFILVKTLHEGGTILILHHTGVKTRHRKVKSTTQKQRITHTTNYCSLCWNPGTPTSEHNSKRSIVLSLKKQVKVSNGLKDSNTASMLNPRRWLWLRNTRVTSDDPRLFCHINLESAKAWKHLTVVSTQTCRGHIIRHGYRKISPHTHPGRPTLSKHHRGRLKAFAVTMATLAFQLWHTCFPSWQEHFRPAKELCVSANDDFSKTVHPPDWNPALQVGKCEPFLGCSSGMQDERKKRTEKHLQNDSNGVSSHFSKTQIELNLSINVSGPSFNPIYFYRFKAFLVNPGPIILSLKFKKKKAFAPHKATIF